MDPHNQQLSLMVVTDNTPVYIWCIPVKRWVLVAPQLKDRLLKYYASVKYTQGHNVIPAWAIKPNMLSGLYVPWDLALKVWRRPVLYESITDRKKRHIMEIPSPFISETLYRLRLSWVSLVIPTNRPSVFNDLPREIRDKIWEYSFIQTTRVLHLTHYQGGYRIYCDNAVPAPMYICKESRAAALRFYSLAFGRGGRAPQIYINWQYDWVYLVRQLNSYGDEVVGHLGNFIDTINPNERRLIQNMVCHVTAQNQLHWTTLVRLQGLRRIAILPHNCFPRHCDERFPSPSTFHKRNDLPRHIRTAIADQMGEKANNELEREVAQDWELRLQRRKHELIITGWFKRPQSMFDRKLHLLELYEEVRQQMITDKGEMALMKAFSSVNPPREFFNAMMVLHTTKKSKARYGNWFMPDLIVLGGENWSRIAAPKPKNMVDRSGRGRKNAVVFKAMLFIRLQVIINEEIFGRVDIAECSTPTIRVIPGKIPRYVLSLVGLQGLAWMRTSMHAEDIEDAISMVELDLQDIERRFIPPPFGDWVS